MLSGGMFSGGMLLERVSLLSESRLAHRARDSSGLTTAVVVTWRWYIKMRDSAVAYMLITYRVLDLTGEKSEEI